jgi:hypothetical protein
LRGKKEHGARVATTAPDGAPASLRATLARKGGEAGQGRYPLAVQRPEFRQVCDEGQRDDASDARDRLQPGERFS